LPSAGPSLAPAGTRGLPGVAVATGDGVTVKVDRGRLVIRDNPDGQPREQYWPRAGHKLQRVVIVGTTGILTLNAIQWCAFLAIPIVVIGPDGRLLFTTAYGSGGETTVKNDARLRRAQAAATDSGVGLDVARYVLTAKLTGAMDCASRYLLDGETVVASLAEAVAAVAKAATAERCREVEGEAAKVYFAAWRDIRARFADGTSTVPDHWYSFGARNSLVSYRRTARYASNPINAMLNYLYTVAASECRLACLALGLDPGLGYLHNDQSNRESLVYDLLEVVRPVVDRWVMTYLGARVFGSDEFVETRIGSCRIQPTLLRVLAATGPLWFQTVAPHAETVTHMIAETSPYPIRKTTPLTASRKRAAKRQRPWAGVSDAAIRATFAHG